MTMNPEVKAAWLEALESGKYKHGQGRLRTASERGLVCCALGVLVDLHREAFHGEWEVTVGGWGYDGMVARPSTRVRDWAGLLHEDCYQVESRSDRANNYAEAVRYIREQL